MKKTLIILVLFGCVISAKSQLPTYGTVDPNLKILPKEKEKQSEITWVIAKLFARKTNMSLIRKWPQDSIYMTSLALCFDARGHLDTLLFPKKIAENTKGSHGLDEQMVDLFKSYDWTKYKCSNQVVLLPLLFVQMRSRRTVMDNHNFLADFENIWPEFGSQLEHRKLVLLQPFISYFDWNHR